MLIRVEFEEFKKISDLNADRTTIFFYRVLKYKQSREIFKTISNEISRDETLVEILVKRRSSHATFIIIHKIFNSRFH